MAAEISRSTGQLIQDSVHLLSGSEGSMARTPLSIYVTECDGARGEAFVTEVFLKETFSFRQPVIRLFETDRDYEDESTFDKKVQMHFEKNVKIFFLANFRYPLIREFYLKLAKDLGSRKSSLHL